jgi:hypothetical protein
MSLVSGREFNKLAKWCYCPRYQPNFVPSLIQENDIVFLNLDYFVQFISILNADRPKHKFILITHNSDTPFTLEHFKYLFDFTNHIFAINCLVKHPNVSCIPIGFSDYSVPNTFQEILNKNYNKEILLYCNFSVDTNKIKRLECINAFSNSNWVLREQNLPPEEFSRKISRSKYVLLPEGAGIDCHHIYECLYFNSLPIIKKTNLDYFYVNFPIVIVNNWNDVTKEFLEDNYERFLNGMIQWKNLNSEWTTAKFWIGIKN